MEDPFLRTEYATLLARHGVDNRMDPSWYEKPLDADTKKTVV
jgi:hypothetical protein